MCHWDPDGSFCSQKAKTQRQEVTGPSSKVGTRTETTGHPMEAIPSTRETQVGQLLIPQPGKVGSRLTHIHLVHPRLEDPGVGNSIYVCVHRGRMKRLIKHNSLKQFCYIFLKIIIHMHKYIICMYVCINMRLPRWC